MIFGALEQRIASRTKIRSLWPWSLWHYRVALCLCVWTLIYVSL